MREIPPQRHTLHDFLVYVCFCFFILLTFVNEHSGCRSRVRPRPLDILVQSGNMAGDKKRSRAQKKAEARARKAREAAAGTGSAPTPEGGTMDVSTSGVVEDDPVINTPTTSSGGKDKTKAKACRFCASGVCSEQLDKSACSEALLKNIERALGTLVAPERLHDLAKELDGRNQLLKVGDADARATVAWQKELVELLAKTISDTDGIENNQARAFNAGMAAHQTEAGTFRAEAKNANATEEMDLALAERKERLKARLAAKLAEVRTSSDCLRWKTACVMSRHIEEVAELRGSLEYFATHVKSMNTQINKYTCFKRAFNKLDDVRFVCIGNEGDYVAQDRFLKQMRPRMRRRLQLGNFWGSSMGIVEPMSVSSYVRKLNRDRNSGTEDKRRPEDFPSDADLNPVASVSYFFREALRSEETCDVRSTAQQFGDVTAVADTWKVVRSLTWYEPWECKCEAERTEDILAGIGSAGFINLLWNKQNSITRGGSHHIFGTGGHRVNCPNHENYGLNDVRWLKRRQMSTEVIISKTQLQTLHAGRYNVAQTDKLFNSIFQGTRTDYRTNLNVGDVAQYGGNHAVAEFAFLNQIRDKRATHRGCGEFEFYDDPCGEPIIVRGNGCVTYLIETQGYGQLYDAVPLE